MESATKPLKREIEKLKKEKQRFVTIAYNAITFAQLDEQYSKADLKKKLGISEEEWKQIVDGDENLEAMK